MSGNRSHQDQKAPDTKQECKSSSNLTSVPQAVFWDIFAYFWDLPKSNKQLPLSI